MANERTLTPQDLADLAEIIKKHQVCSLGIAPELAKALNELTPEQIGILRRGMIITGKAAYIVGGTILVSIVGFFIVIFSKGWWLTFATGIVRKGIQP